LVVVDGEILKNLYGNAIAVYEYPPIVYELLIGVFVILIFLPVTGEGICEGTSASEGPPHDVKGATLRIRCVPFTTTAVTRCECTTGTRAFSASYSRVVRYSVKPNVLGSHIVRFDIVELGGVTSASLNTKYS
jgi:hypothetical protein